jgi:heme a synthase
MSVGIQAHRYCEKDRSVFAVSVEEVPVVMAWVSTLGMCDWLRGLVDRIVVERCDHDCDRSHSEVPSTKWQAVLLTPTVQGMARLTGKSYSIVCGTALGSLCVIVFSGALVRLTGSGLGCVDWPNCNSTKFIDVSSGHTAIEQANRLFTGVVSFSVMAAVLLSHRRTPRRSDLVWLSWSLVIGVLAQIVIGGIVVLTGLNPYANMTHFLVSMVLIACSFMLYRRSGMDAPSSFFRNVPSRLRGLVIALSVAGVSAIVTGTVVTATGPHAGGEDAVRFGFTLTSVARIHGATVIVFVALIVVLAIQDRRHRSSSDLTEAISALLVVALAQGAIGYTQYFTGVPVVLVAAHIIGAISMFLALCHLVVAPRDVVKPLIDGPAY